MGLGHILVHIAIIGRGASHHPFEGGREALQGMIAEFRMNFTEKRLQICHRMSRHSCLCISRNSYNLGISPMDKNKKMRPFHTLSRFFFIDKVRKGRTFNNRLHFLLLLWTTTCPSFFLEVWLLALQLEWLALNQLTPVAIVIIITRLLAASLATAASAITI